jgi:hypothetical protein
LRTAFGYIMKNLVKKRFSIELRILTGCLWIVFLYPRQTLATERIPVNVTRPENFTEQEPVAGHENFITAEQRLRERYQRWRDLDPEHKEKIHERYEKFKTLPPEEQERIRLRWQEFQDLSETSKQAIRQRHERWKQLSGDEKRKLLLRRQWYRDLPPEQKKKLLERRRWWQSCSPEERKKLRQQHNKNRRAMGK